MREVGVTKCISDITLRWHPEDLAMAAEDRTVLVRGVLLHDVVAVVPRDGLSPWSSDGEKGDQ